MITKINAGNYQDHQINGNELEIRIILIILVIWPNSKRLLSLLVVVLMKLAPPKFSIRSTRTGLLKIQILILLCFMHLTSLDSEKLHIYSAELSKLNHDQTIPESGN